MREYRPHKIEPKWQKKWESANLHRAADFDKRPKRYILVEFPYPSGDRLHVGHGRTYCALDAVARKNRMAGYNVLFPFGWDAFGLPAENYAIERGVSPQVTTAKNIANAKAQAKNWGLSIDWDREVSTTDPSYYRWTQWIFLKLLERGLAYQAEVPVNWCPKCKTNLANEEVLADGTHERCGQPTERRMQKQWLLKITEYADRLLEDLELVDYLPKIKAQQVNWIGRSDGAEIEFPILDSDLRIPVFSTRPDTVFGVTFLALAPEHPVVAALLSSKFNPPRADQSSKLEEVRCYVEEAKHRSELDRISQAGEKTGIFTGLYVINPLSSEKIPVYVADFVLGSYGTGAVMGVPGHDQRDFDFAKKYGLAVRQVIASPTSPNPPYPPLDSAYEDYGVLAASGKYTGLHSKEAIAKITEDLEKQGLGRKAVSYHLRDWVFSRQHYWGEPIPVVHCKKCGVVPVPEEDLPVKLPYVENYQPSGMGESPLATVSEWVKTVCPRCCGPAERETDTMPNWAGSNWYFLRYCDPQNDREFANLQKLNYWMPVDLYNGGMEHTTLHLLYSRFIYKFLYDCNFVPGSEPYAKRTSHGVVLGPDGQKMSKSRGNVINPDDVIEAYGADSFRVYEAFMGPFGQAIAWDPKGVEGCHRFLNRVWRLVSEAATSGTSAGGTRPIPQPSRLDPRKPRRFPSGGLENTEVRGIKSDPELERELHRLIKKVGEDTEALKFNTAIAAFMGFLNEVQEKINTERETDYHGLSKDDWGIFLRLLAPFAPHITEELWCEVLGNEFSIHQQSWPEYDSGLVEEERVTIVVQINGKVRERFETEKGLSEEEAIEIAKALPKVKKHLAGKEVIKVIWVQDRLVNFVTGG